MEQKDKIQSAFFQHVIRIDKMIETELRKTLKYSFQEFYKAIHGDDKSKTNPVQLFKVYIDIEEKKNEFELMFSPPVSDLSDTVTKILNNATNILAKFRRLETDMLEVRTKAIAELLKKAKEN